MRDFGDPPLVRSGFVFFVDVSSPGKVDFGQLRASGCDAVFIKTGDGLGEGFANTEAPGLADKARAAGLRIGFYHYNRPRRLAEGKVAKEAEWMHELVDRAGGLQPGVDIRVIMDVEAPDAKDLAVDVAEFTRRLRVELRSLFGHEPLLYSGWDYANHHLRSVGGDLWVAWYPPGGLPLERARQRWHEVPDGQAQLGQLQPVAWQYGGDVTGGVPGVGKCDTNVSPVDRYVTMIIPGTRVMEPPAEGRFTSQTSLNGRTTLAFQETATSSSTAVSEPSGRATRPATPTPMSPSRTTATS